MSRPFSIYYTKSDILCKSYNNDVNNFNYKCHC